LYLSNLGKQIKKLFKERAFYQGIFAEIKNMPSFQNEKTLNLEPGA